MEIREQNNDKNDKIKSLIQKNLELESKISFLELSLSSLKDFDEEEDLDVMDMKSKNEIRKRIEEANKYVK